MTDLITEDEIENLKKDPVTVTIADLLNEQIRSILPLKLRSGYQVIYSVQDVRPDGRRFELLSVYRKAPVPDPADSEHIAKAVLGPGYKQLGLITGAYRFYKIIDSTHQV